MIGAWIESGRIVDLILGLIVIEACLLVLWLRSRSKSQRTALRGLLANLAAGAFLLLALRSVLGGAGVVIVGSWLALALLAHLVDLAERMGRRSSS